MRKKFLLALMCSLFVMGSFDTAIYSTAAVTKEEALEKSFESTGADVLESVISCWAKLNCNFLGMKEIEAEMKRISDRINPDSAKIVKSFENDGGLNKITLYGIKGNKAYSIAMESIKEDDGGETYITFDVSMDKSYKDLAEEKRNIMNAVQADCDSINFSSCIIGTYKGRLSDAEVERKTRAALQSINAEEVEGIENGGLKSISAFSFSLGGYPAPDRLVGNMQLATRYSSYDDSTYIWIGTPLIPTVY